MLKSSLALCALLAVAAWSPSARAQFTVPSVTDRPALSYGYQPYDTSKPTGFNHPHNMGYGTYHNPTKLKGHRSRTMRYRRFRGY